MTNELGTTLSDIKAKAEGKKRAQQIVLKLELADIALPNLISFALSKMDDQSRAKEMRIFIDAEQAISEIRKLRGE